MSQNKIIDVFVIGSRIEKLNETFMDSINKLVKDNFPDTDRVVPISNKVTETALKAHLKENKERAEMMEVYEYIKNPEKVKNVLTQAENLYSHVQKTDRFFTLKEVVDNTNLTYKGANDILNLIYCFGFLVKKKEDNREFFKVVISKEDKLRFIRNRIAEQLNIIESFNKTLKEVEKE